MAKLVCQTGPTAGHEYVLTKDVTVMGRQSSCDVQILDNMSSRAHAQVRRDGKLYSLVDLGSRNGTNLNGKKVTERQLAFGDRIRVGEVEYLFVKEAGDVELKDLLSKYEVQEKIGEGGMGIVYKANQRSMARIVALKILSPKYSSRPRFVEQFIREARAAGALNHPNIIQVHDVGTENDIHYFSMEYVEGPTCMQVLRKDGPFKPAEALEIIRQTAKALEYAHSQRLIHQDIKPDNIMLAQGNVVKLADLGISKTFDEAEAEEGPKRVMGTPHYMAPEAALGKRIDHRVDIYSLGATLYHLLTGKTPFTGTSATEVLKAHVMDPLPAIQDMVPDVPDDVCALVERLVAKKPDDRYQQASEVVAEIGRLQAGTQLGIERIGGGETMLLRRYAAGPAVATSAATVGAPGTTAQPTPAATTGARGVRATDGGHTTMERLRPARMRQSTMVGIAIGALVLVLLAVAVMRSLGDANTPHPARPPSPTTPVNPTAGNDHPADPEPDQSAARQSAALAMLEDKLRGGGDALDLGALGGQVDQLIGQGPAKPILDRARVLRSRIGDLVVARATADLERDLAELRGQVLKLDEDHDYELALKRIDAFRGKDEPAVKEKVASLHDVVTKARDSYLSSLHDRIQLAVAGKNLPRLKELSEQLPPALLDSDLDKEVKSAIKTIESDIQTQQQAVLTRVAADLAHWNLSAVTDAGPTNRTLMAGSGNGKQLDSLVETARRLDQFTAALGAQFDKMKASTGRGVRYKGILNGWTDPDMVGADNHGLQLEVVGGGTASPRWQEIAPDVLNIICTTILPKEEAEQYRAALQVLASVRISSGGAPEK